MCQALASNKTGQTLPLQENKNLKNREIVTNHRRTYKNAEVMPSEEEWASKREEASLLLQAAGQEPGPKGRRRRKEQRAELSGRELGFMQRSGREGGRGQSSKK